MEIRRYNRNYLRVVAILSFLLKLRSAVALLSIFLYSSTSAHADNPREWRSLSPAAQASWAALLHFHNNEFQITDEGFFLGKKPYSLQSEFDAAHQLLIEPSNDLQCRFPARYTWLAQLGGASDAGLKRCNDINEYLARVPAETVSLIFSSENVSKPSSMMGHILLKIDGTQDGIQKSHAVSFYTDLNSVNVPKIIYDSLIVGKDGIFALSPYSEKKAYYLDREGRNIWEYKIALSSEAIERLLLHIWELKQTKISYFFDAYNCATLTNNLLGVADIALLEQSQRWLTPLDVVKHVNRSGMVATTTIETAPKWRVRMLSSALSHTQISAVVGFLESGEFKPALIEQKPEHQFLMLKLADEYSRIPQNNKPAAYKIRGDEQQRLHELSDAFNIDLSEYKSPLRTPGDSQLSLGIQHLSDSLYARLAYLPAGHDIDDDNRQYFTENALKLGYISVLANDDSVKLETLTLYEVTSLTPSDPWLGGLSGHFHLGFRQAYDDDLQRQLNFDVSGGVGKSFEPVRQVKLYGLLVGGLGSTKDKRFAYIAPEAGAVFNEKGNMKTHLKVRYSHNELNNERDLWRASVSQMKFFSSRYSIRLQYEWMSTGHAHEHLTQLELKRYF